MKILFTVLLIAAIGGGAYYYFSTRSNSSPQEAQKELIIGKWKMDSLDIHEKDSAAGIAILLLALDSNLVRYEYDFKTNGNVLVSLPDSANTDTSHYEWNDQDQLVWREYLSDSTTEVFSVVLLNQDSLVLQSQDSTKAFFHRAQ